MEKRKDFCGYEGDTHIPLLHTFFLVVGIWNVPRILSAQWRPQLKTGQMSGKHQLTTLVGGFLHGFTRIAMPLESVTPYSDPH